MYANNSVIDVNLVGEGFEGAKITDGGALECHTDDTTCCRGIDNPNGTGRGEWYYPDGTVVLPPGGDTGFYRTRDHMVVRLNRAGVTAPIEVYRCEIPGTGGTTIIRYVKLTLDGNINLLVIKNLIMKSHALIVTVYIAATCSDLPKISIGARNYIPPHSSLRIMSKSL